MDYRQQIRVTSVPIISFFLKEALLRKFERYALIPARGDRVERLIVSLRPRMPGRCMIPDVYGKTGLNAAVHPKYDFR